MRVGLMWRTASEGTARHGTGHHLRRDLLEHGVVAAEEAGDEGEGVPRVLLRLHVAAHLELESNV